MQKYVDDNKRTVHSKGHAFLPFVTDFYFFFVYRKSNFLYLLVTSRYLF